MPDQQPGSYSMLGHDTFVDALDYQTTRDALQDLGRNAVRITQLTIPGGN